MLTKPKASTTTFVSPIRTARTKAGLSRPELAKRAGISASILKFAEHGMRVSRPTLERLGLALGVKPESLQP